MIPAVIPLTSLIAWIFFGLATGLVIQLLDSDSNDLPPALILSIIGAVLGGVLGQSLLGSGLNLSNLLIIVSGSLTLSLAGKILLSGAEREVSSADLASAYYSQISPVTSARGISRLAGRVKYPVSKRDLVRLAEKEGYDSQNLSLLEGLPDHIYQSRRQIDTELKRSVKQ